GDFTNMQLRRFNSMIKVCKGYNLNLKYIHSANSAAIIAHPDTYFNLVRAGIAIYGYYPSAKKDIKRVELSPILEWRTKIVHIKYIDPKDSIGYGRAFIANRPMKVATIPVGYADGYNRRLSN